APTARRPPDRGSSLCFPLVGRVGRFAPGRRGLDRLRRALLGAVRRAGRQRRIVRHEEVPRAPLAAAGRRALRALLGDVADADALAVRDAPAALRLRDAEPAALVLRARL